MKTEHFSSATRPPRFKGLRVPLVLGAAVVVASGVGAQGLMDIGPRYWPELDVPLTGSFNSSIGWDSEPGAGSGFSTGSGVGGRDPGAPEGDSMVWQNSINLAYQAKSKGRNRFGITGNYSNLWYFDPPAGVDEFDNTGRVTVVLARELTRSLTLTNSAYVSYQTDPDFDTGETVNQRTTGYFLGSNNLSADYQWNRRLTTVTGWRISSVLYEDDTLDNESYVRNELSQQFRYAFKRRLTGTLTYRYTIADYEESEVGDDSDYQASVVLAGVDYAWNRRLSISASAGVEYRTYDASDFDDEVAPRVEAAVNYILAKRTTARWVNAFSLDDSGRTGSQSGGYSYRTGLSLNHIFTRRLSGNLALNYVFQNYGDSVEIDGVQSGGINEGDENTFYASIGFNYRLWKTWGLTGSYSYSMVNSDDELSDYDRSRVFFGVSYTF